MNHENISLQDLLDIQAEVCKQIKNCKTSKKQIFESKNILELGFVAQRFEMQSAPN